MITNSPILVMVYNRIESLKECIESLKLCQESSDSILYISSDAAYRDEDISIIDDVRNYIKTIVGFKEVIPIIHQTNKGLLQSYTISKNKIFENYETMIFLEDDIIVAPNFLKFINEGLDFYKLDENIISISGFSHSVFFDFNSELKEEVYFTNRWCPWGFGTWKEKINKIPQVSLSELKNNLNDSTFSKNLDNIGIDLYTAFKRKLEQGNELVLDYLFVYYLVKNNFFTVTPYSTKTFNIGNDGKGTRTRKNKKFVFFDKKTLNNTVDYKFSKYNPNLINNTFNFLNNNNLTSKIKKGISKLGLLHFGYVMNDYKKKWSKKIKK